MFGKVFTKKSRFKNGDLQEHTLHNGKLNITIYQTVLDHPQRQCWLQNRTRFFKYLLVITFCWLDIVQNRRRDVVAIRMLTIDSVFIIKRMIFMWIGRSFHHPKSYPIV